MKKISIACAVACLAIACNNDSQTEASTNDSVNTMDQNRQTDTRTFNPADSMDSKQVDTAQLRRSADSLARSSNTSSRDTGIRR